MSPLRPSSAVLAAAPVAAPSVHSLGVHSWQSRDPDVGPLEYGVVGRIGSGKLRHGAAVRSLAFSPDGGLLVSADKQGAVIVWEAGDRAASSAGGTCRTGSADRPGSRPTGTGSSGGPPTATSAATTCGPGSRSGPSAPTRLTGSGRSRVGRSSVTDLAGPVARLGRGDRPPRRDPHFGEPADRSGQPVRPVQCGLHVRNRPDLPRPDDRDRPGVRPRRVPLRPCRLHPLLAGRRRRCSSAKARAVCCGSTGRPGGWPTGTVRSCTTRRTGWRSRRTGRAWPSRPATASTCSTRHRGRAVPTGRLLRPAAGDAPVARRSLPDPGRLLHGPAGGGVGPGRPAPGVGVRPSQSPTGRPAPRSSRSGRPTAGSACPTAATPSSTSSTPRCCGSGTSTASRLWSVKKGLSGRGGYGFSPDGSLACVVEEKGLGRLPVGDRLVGRAAAVRDGAVPPRVGRGDRVHAGPVRRRVGPPVRVGVLPAGRRVPARARCACRAGESLEGREGLLALSPDGRLAVVGTDRLDLIVFELATLQERYRVSTRHRGPASSVLFARDGRHLIVANGDSTVTIHDLAAGPGPLTAVA